MLFTVSVEASSFGSLSNIGSTKTLLFLGFDQNALTNLIICKIVSSMLGLSIPRPRGSSSPFFYLKKDYYLFIILLLFLFSRYKSSSPSKMDQHFPSTPTFSLSENEFGCYHFNSGHLQEAKNFC